MLQYSTQNVMYRGLTYDEAYSLMKRNELMTVITRPEWEGYHFDDRFEGGTNLGYMILTKDDKLIVNPKEIYNKDARDWQVVLLTHWQILHLSSKINEVEESNA